MTKHLGTEGIWFIGSERELGIHKRWRNVQISRGIPLKVGSRAPNGKAQPYIYPTTSNSLFLQVSIIWSFSSILRKPARRGSTWDFISKPTLEALGQRRKAFHQHKKVVEKRALVLKFRVSVNLLQNWLRAVFLPFFRDVLVCVSWWVHFIVVNILAL